MMTPEEAKRLILAQLNPDSGEGEPQTFLGGLRPFRQVLPEARFHDLMAALRVLAPTLGTGATVDRELVSALWSIAEMTRLWALDEDGMIRRNDLISEPDLALLRRWYEMYSYAVMILLEIGSVDEAFPDFDAYLEEPRADRTAHSDAGPERADWIFEDGLRPWLELVGGAADHSFDEADWDAVAAGLRDTDAELGRWFSYMLGTEPSAVVEIALERGTSVIRTRVSGSVRIRRCAELATQTIQRYRLSDRQRVSHA